MIIWEKVTPAVLTLANQIIYDHHPWLVNYRIGFVFRSEPVKKGGRLVIGNTSKVPPKLEPHLKLDFVVWLAKDEWDRLPEMQRRALVDHELCHIHVNGRLVSHDVEEFAAILQRYGLWNRDLWRMKNTFEQACQLRLPVGEVGGAVAVDPGRLPAEAGEEPEEDGEDEEPIPVELEALSSGMAGAIVETGDEGQSET